MAADYGGGRGKKGIGMPAILIGAVVLIAAFAIGGWAWKRPREIAKAQAWAITGPPCPTLSKQAYDAQFLKIKYRTEVNDLTFGRNSGSISCDDIVEDGGKGLGKFTECQFTSPSIVEVTTEAGDFYFLLQTGRATVWVKHGQATCVRGGWYAGEA